MTRVLLVEDDPDLAHVLALYLRDAGITVEHTADGQDAWGRFQAAPHDAVMLDVNVPRIDGFELCRRLRSVSDVPIMIITARDAETDELLGLELGADDYLVKPFSPRLASARLRGILRRSAPSPPERLSIGRVEIDLDSRAVTVDGVDIPDLRAKEYDLLSALAARPGKVFTKAELQQALYGWDSFVGSRAVDQHITNLRAKLPDPAIVRTVRGIGYQLVT